MPRAPKTRGDRFRTDVLDTYEGLTVTELVLLDRAAATLDRIDELEAAIAEHGVVVVGSRGQSRASGLLISLNDAEAGLRATLSALNLPDPDASAKPVRSRGGYTYGTRRGGVRG